MQELVGKLWPGYKIDKVIGEGSFGKVYQIRREEFGYVYINALKVISIPNSSAELYTAINDGMDEASVTTYFRGVMEEVVKEVQLMYQLKGNSNIVNYEDHRIVPHNNGIGWDIYIRMELLTPFFEHYRSLEREYSNRHVAQLGIDICSALEVCQTYKIIHRDIKPENIFISRTGNYKLGDFGIARQMEKTSSAMSKKGTFLYMAPEVFRNEDYDLTVDIYSLGVVLYRFLNQNKVPFLPNDGKTITHSDKEMAMAMRMKGKPLPVPVKADVPLAEIVMKACAFRPEDRYQTPTEMRKALEKVLPTLSTEPMKEFTEPVKKKEVIPVFEEDDYTGTMILFGDEEREKRIQEAKRKAEEARRRREEEERRQAEEAERRRREEEERRRMEEIRRREAEEAERRRLAEEARRLEEERRQAEEAERRRLEEIRRREEEARRREEEARRAAEEAERRRLAEERRKAEEEERRRKAEEEKRRKAEEAERRRLAEAEKRRKAEEEKLRKAEEKRQREEAAKRKKEEARQRKAEAKAESETKSQSKGKKVLIPVAAALVVLGGVGIYFGTTTVVPTLYGYEKSMAEDLLEEASLNYVYGEPEYSTFAKKDEVIDVENEGKRVKKNTTVEVRLSLGLESTLEKYSGMTEEEALKEAEYYGLEAKIEYEYSDEVKEGIVISQKPEQGTTVREGAQVELVISQGEKPIELEKYEGESLESIEKEIKELGLELEVKKEYSTEVKKGKVISQSPEAGKELKKGDKLTLTVSKGAEQVKVPKVTGKSQAEAEKALKKAGFKLGSVSYAYSNSVGSGIVMSQGVAAGSKTDKGSSISIVISRGKQPVKKPANTGNSGSSDDGPTILDDGPTILN